MVYYLSIPFPVERSPPDSTTTYSLSFSSSNLSRDGPSDVGPSIPSSLPVIPLTTSSSNLSSSSARPQSSTSGTSNPSTSNSGSTSGSRSNTEVSSTFQALTPSQPFPVSTESLSSATTSGPMVSQASVYPSDVGNGYLQETITPIGNGPSPPVSLTSSSLSSPSSTSSESTVVVTGSNSAMITSTSLVSSTSIITSISSAAYTFPSSHVASTPSLSTSSIVTSTITPSTSTFVVSTTEADESSSTVVIPPWTSTLILTSVLPNSGTTAWTTTTSGVLSTAGVANTIDMLSRSPGSIIGISLGILGAFAFAVLWLFCARRRQRQLSRDASAIPPWAPGGPLEAEIDMEEPYAGILAALNAGMGAGRDAHIEGDTSGEVSGELAIPYTSSPTLPLYSLPGDGHSDGLFVFPLSPPPSTQVPPPPSAYAPPGSSKGPRRRSSPGPDASAWFGGYHIAPAASVISHHSYSTSNILTRTETGTRTRTGSEEPLLTRAGSGSSSYLGSGNKIRLGSAFGSPKDCMNGHDLSPTSLSSGKRSNTVSSFGALGSVSSQGALRSTSSHGYDFGFGSASSGAGSHSGPAVGLAISGVSTSYVSRRPIKWKKGNRENTGSSMSASALSSTDEKPAGVRAFLDRIRLRNTPSPNSDSSRDIESEGASEKRNTDASGPHISPRAFSAVLSPATPSPEPVHVPTSPRFVLSNPDPQPHSPYVRVEAEGALQGHEGGLRPPAWPCSGHRHANLLPPSPALTLESRITMAEGLLDPRLCETIEGRSNASLRDFEDYSRPIGGLVNNRMNSTTTFGTVDSLEGVAMRNREDDLQEDIHSRAIATPHASWALDVDDNDFHAY